jgi:ferric-dicitrate binding protein FerR (iron transport regulator)
MKQDPYRVAYLVAGFIRNTLDDKERDELDEWVVASDENMALFAELTDDDNIEKSLVQIEDIDKQAELKKLLSRTADDQKPKTSKRFWMYAAAAVLVLLTGLFFIYRYTATGDKKVAKDEVLTQEDIFPAGNKATLRIGDDNAIDLVNAPGGLIKKTNGTLINKTNDGLNYKAVDKVAGETIFHVLTVAGGGQFSVTLSDGTTVWLNAASSLRYPDHFTGTQRKVELTGEAYFEVAKNTRPFIVRTPGNNEINVVGTHFNVKAYTDENNEAVTLLEGSVEVKSNAKKTTLAPGEQVVITQNELVVDRSADTESIIAWKNHLFKFNDAPIEEIMKQVGRWYNATIVYETKTNHHFNATISRDKPVSKLLRYLELTGLVHFKIENNKIIVMK